MSYGVVASETGQVQVETVVSTGERNYERARERFRPPLTSHWGSGQLTLTTLHLSFEPAQATIGVRPLSIALSDILSVEASPGRVSKMVSFHTADQVLHARVSGTMDFAKQVAISAEAARKRNFGPQFRKQSTQTLS